MRQTGDIGWDRQDERLNQVCFYSNQTLKGNRSREEHVTEFRVRTQVNDVSADQVSPCRCSVQRSGSLRWMTVMVMSSRYLLASSTGRLSILARRFGATAPYPSSPRAWRSK